MRNAAIGRESRFCRRQGVRTEPGMDPRRSVMRLLTMLAVAIVATQLFAGSSTDRFDAYFEKAKASGYVNCGRVAIGGANRESVDACVLKRLAEGRPFFARYDQQGIDSRIAIGLMLAETKVLSVIQFDDWTCATPSCAHPEVCNSPRIAKTKSGLHVRCTNDYDL